MIGSERNTDYPIKLSHRITYRLTKSMRDLCIANSSSGASFNARKLNYPPEHYRIVYNGVDTDRFRPLPRDAGLQALGLDTDLFWIGTFASFKERKNHPMLFRAAKRLIENYPDVRFLLVGDELAGGQHGSSDYKSFILQMIKDSGLRDYCELLGNRSDVHAVYPACDLTALPSRIEGTPNVALESMACGVPVIATDVSDNARAIPDGVAGRIVPLDDDAAMASAIGELIDNSELRSRLAAGARQWVENEFTTSKLAAETLRVYYAAATGLAGTGRTS